MLKVINCKHVDDECTDVAKDLLVKCRSGEIKAFVAIAIDGKDNTSLYVGNSVSDRKNLLQLMGAVWMLNHFSFEVMDDNSEDE